MNKIDRRSFMKLAGVAALAAGMVTLTGCEGTPVQALLPLRFEWVGGNTDSDSWDEYMKELDQAHLAIAPIQDEEKRNAAILALVSAEIVAHPDKYNKLNPLQLDIAEVTIVGNHLDGGDSLEMLVSMTTSKLPR